MKSKEVSRLIKNIQKATDEAVYYTFGKANTDEEGNNEIYNQSTVLPIDNFDNHIVSALLEYTSLQSPHP